MCGALRGVCACSAAAAPARLASGGSARAAVSWLRSGGLSRLCGAGAHVMQGSGVSRRLSAWVTDEPPDEGHGWRGRGRGRGRERHRQGGALGLGDEDDVDNATGDDDFDDADDNEDDNEDGKGGGGGGGCGGGRRDRPPVHRRTRAVVSQRGQGSGPTLLGADDDDSDEAGGTCENRRWGGDGGSWEPRQRLHRFNHAKQVVKYLDNATLAYLGRYSTCSANMERVLERKLYRIEYRVNRNRTEKYPPFLTEEVREGIREVVQKYVAMGAIDDAAYTRAKVASMRRKGRSKRAILSALRVKGVPVPMIEEALRLHSLDADEIDPQGGRSYHGDYDDDSDTNEPDGEDDMVAEEEDHEMVAEAQLRDELKSATVYARKKRLGPYKTPRGGKPQVVEYDVYQKDLAKLFRQGYAFDVAKAALSFDVARAVLDEERYGVESESDADEEDEEDDTVTPHPPPAAVATPGDHDDNAGDLQPHGPSR